jgi:hypothetical protein
LRKGQSDESSLTTPASGINEKERINTNVSVIPGEQVFVAVLDLTSWANAVSGGQWYIRTRGSFRRNTP